MRNVMVQMVSFGYLLVGSFYFGFVGRPTEMGLSILAGVLALAFTNLDKISKFKGAGFEAEMRDKVEAIISKESEPSHTTEESSYRVAAFSYDEDAEKVIKCLGNSRYTWRTISGIAKETQLPLPTIKKSLGRLIDNDFARRTGAGTEIKWALTDEGRELLNSM